MLYYALKCYIKHNKQSNLIIDSVQNIKFKGKTSIIGHLASYEYTQRTNQRTKLDFYLIRKTI